MLEIDYELKDIIISAFRYAMGRKSYITLAVCDYIVKHPDLIDGKVKNVLLRDLKNLDMYYTSSDIDFEVFKSFEKWLEKLEVK